MTAKIVYFFKDERYVRYNARTDELEPALPRRITDTWHSWPPSFAGGVDAAVNWGDGQVFFFKGPNYLRYDVLADRVPNVDPPYPRPIVGNWPGWPRAGAFASGVDAAVNWGNGKVYFFKGSKYLRYSIVGDHVDMGYPLDIAGGTWHNWPGQFASGIDAAVNWGDGTAFFFKGPDYLKYDIVNDVTFPADPPYPRPTAKWWTALAGAGFASAVSTALEWPYAEAIRFDAPLNRSGCMDWAGFGNAIHESFDMQVDFGNAYPAACWSGEYRQEVRGHTTANGRRVEFLLADPDGGVRPLLPRPAPGAPGDNFQEDGIPAAKSPFGVNTFAGHRHAPYGNGNGNDQYLPERTAGCEYRGHDEPGLSHVRAGNTVEIDADFRARLIDMANGNSVVDTRTWTVTCRKAF